MHKSMRITAAALALAVGFTGAAQAQNFNIFSASTAQETVEKGNLEQVRRRHSRDINPGAAFALGTMGLIAGAAAASSYDRGYSRRYCDPYYEYCGRRYARRYYEPRYYEPRRYYYYD